jgi:hypothetical protein
MLLGPLAPQILTFLQDNHSPFRAKGLSLSVRRTEVLTWLLFSLIVHGHSHLLDNVSSSDLLHDSITKPSLGIDNPQLP